MARKLTIASLRTLAKISEQMEQWLEGLGGHLNASDAANTLCCSLVELLHRMPQLGRQTATDAIFGFLRETVPFPRNPALWTALHLYAEVIGEGAGVLSDVESPRLLEELRADAQGRALLKMLTSEASDIASILLASGDQGQSDFYEYFVAARDAQDRGRHGVYYTPPALADFLIERVHDGLLQLGLPDGILDETHWSAWAEQRGIAIPNEAEPEAPVVQILDPAAGTGAFMTAVVRFAHRLHREAKRSQSQWSQRVEKLLVRLHANEWMAAAAAIGQLRMTWTLFQTGYQPTGQQQPCLQWTIADALAAPTCEALPASVIVGNPPYRSGAAMEGNWIERLMRGTAASGSSQDPTAETLSYYDVDGQQLNERKVWLQDLYVRFLRWSQWRIDTTGCGVVAFVLNHGLLENVTFRGVREKLKRSFQAIDLVDLHGNVKAKERSPDGRSDENLFGIATGVAALVLRKCPALNRSQPTVVRRTDLWGLKADKENVLRGWAMGAPPPWRAIRSSPPLHLFADTFEIRRPDYEQSPSITDLMPLHSTAPVTARDSVVIDRCRDRLVERLCELADLSISDETIRSRYFTRRRSTRYPPGDTRGWKLPAARRRLATLPDPSTMIRRCLYRPFDWRYVCWAEWMIDWPRPEVTQHFERPNIAIIARRQMLPTQPCNYFWATAQIAFDGVIRSDNRGSESIFPLWLYDGPSGACSANFCDRHVLEFSQRTQLRWVADEEGDLTETMGAINLLSYVYGLFLSPSYQETYASYLHRDFPRVLLPDRTTFCQLSRAGRILLELHTSEPDEASNHWTLPEPLTTPTPMESEHAIAIGGRRFHVPDEVWQYRVGGYQVVQKWLKTRRGETLGRRDQLEFNHLVQTIRLTLGQTGPFSG